MNCTADRPSRLLSMKNLGVVVYGVAVGCGSSMPTTLYATNTRFTRNFTVLPKKTVEVFIQRPDGRS